MCRVLGCIEITLMIVPADRIFLIFTCKKELFVFVNAVQGRKSGIGLTLLERNLLFVIAF